MKKYINRRSFLKTSAVALGSTAFTIIPAHAAPKTANSKERSELPPSEKLNIAIIGCSHQGGGIGKWATGSEHTNVIALCDVHKGRTAEHQKLSPQAEIFQDFRQLFDKLGGKIDACTIGVPDHAHFPIAMLAMSQGASVYVEKPLAHTFEECALLMKAEKKYGVACQMGNQGHSGNNYVQFRDWVKAGVIKNVRRVDAHMNQGRRWHPWFGVKGFPEAQPVPEGMDWDTWLGTAPEHTYHERFDPGNWRGWHEFGCGAMGDWGCHTIDTIHQFLELGLPYEIRADKLRGQNDYIYPKASTIVFEFAARGENMPAMSLYWYDGIVNKPPRPEELEKGRKIDQCGKIIYSDDLIFKAGTHGSTLRIIPEKKMKAMAKDLPKITEVQSDHMTNLLLAAKGQEKCRSSFDVAGPLSQVMALGCISQRLGGTLKFDTEKQCITNNKRANDLLKGHPPRQGWEEFYKL